MNTIPEDQLIAVERRLESKTAYSQDSDCWIWTGLVTPRGYGSVYAGSHANGINRGVLAHRASYMLYFGCIPGKSRITQTCGNKLCVNPSHLTATGNKALNKTFGDRTVTIEAVKVVIRNLPGRKGRVVEVANDLQIPCDTETLESLETLLENPDHFKPLVKSGKKYYQAI